MNSDRLNKDEIKEEILHSKRDIASYGVSDFILNIFYISFGAYVFYFYEAELGLESWLAAIGFIIYAIWNAINDPLVGIICDRPFFSQKNGGDAFYGLLARCSHLF